MSNENVPLASWIRELREQVVRGRHPILWGNVYDHFPYEGQFLTVDEVLSNYFRFELSYDIVGRYDPVDGFRFAEPAMAQAFEQLCRQGLQPGRPTVSEGTRPASSPTQPPPRSVPPTQAASDPHGRILPWAEAAGRIRLALRQSRTSVMIQVDLADLMTGQADHYADEERQLLGLLKKCTLEASIVDTRGVRNTVVFTSSDLQKVPLWLHRENPIVAIIAVGRPGRTERRWFAERFQEDFYAPQVPSAVEKARLLEEFADLTEGFRCWDLEALMRTSHAERIPFHRLRALIDFYKFGLKDDPWQNLDRERVVRARPSLTRRVLGQQEAVEAVVSMLTSAQVGVSLSPGSASGGRPKGVFFFVGPTGVGKTELAKALTELVFGDEKAFARFDMSEYKEEHAAEKLAGAPPGFVGYEEGGQLTNRVLKNPHSILLFDEIEKAHPRVLDKFLQVLEDGRLTDGKGQTAYFHQTAIIFTSNIGASDFADPHSGALIRPGILTKARGTTLTFAEIRQHFQEEVNWYFTSRIGRAELLNRLGDNIVVFDILRPEFVTGITEKFLAILQVGARERLGLELAFLPGVTAAIQHEMEIADNLMFGGRRVKSLLETHLERPLNRWLFEQGNLEALRGTRLSVNLAADGRLQVSRD